MISHIRKIVYWSCFGSGRRRRRSKTNDNSCNSQTAMVSKAEKNTSESVSSAERERDISVEPVLSSKVFTFGELAYATENFSDESFIGQGGFGSVYRGKLERTDQVVAVKKLDQTGVQGEREFLVEVLMLSLMRHSNLVNLVGYCAEGNQRLLVYEFMPLGSLESRLHDRSPNVNPLDWDTRMMIAMGTAKGLNYLHNEADPPVIYRDLKSANILLDGDFHPKLSDFGLAKFGPSGDQTHVSTRVMGTHGYCAPEYAITGKLTSKSDIYSFGVVLLELITGRRAVDEERGDDSVLVAWARPWMEDRKTCSVLGDPDLNGQVSESVLTKAIEVASMCLRENPSTRPQISDIVLALDFIASCTRKKHKGGRWRADESRYQNGKMKIQKKDRELAIAEAKMWADAFRENKSQGRIINDVNATSR